MKTNEIISKIKKCINEAHKYSEGLGKSTSIHKDYLINCLGSISPYEIHIALLQMEENGEIKFAEENSDVILLTESYKPEVEK